MSKILANQIANYGDDAPIEIKEGLNIPAGKPIQAAGSAGSAGQVLSTTGTTVQWISPFDGDYNSLTNTPNIPAAQVNSDWNASSGVARILNKPVVPPQPSVTTAAAGTAALSYNSTNGEFTFTPPDLSGYLTSYTETDPVFAASDAAAVTAAKISNWDTAYGWGNHASAGYLTSYTETQTLDDVLTLGQSTSQNILTTGKIFYSNNFADLATLNNVDTSVYHGMFAHVHAEGHGYFAHAGAWTQLLDTGSSISELADVNLAVAPQSGQVLAYDGSNWVATAAGGGGGGISLTDLSVTTNAAGSAALTYNNVSGVFTYTPPDLSGYLTSFTETDPVFSVSPAASITTTQINNWDTAYGWGDHRNAGYLGSQATNVVIGDATTGDAITTGDQNVVIGSNAGSAITTKTNNVFIGHNAGAADIGSYNVAIGPEAGDTSYGEFQNVENVAVGRLAGDLRNGNGNTALGFAALSSSATSSSSFFNIAIGYYSMGDYKIDGASYNTCIGQQTGYNLSSGDVNILIGDYAGLGITTGSNNVIIGTQAGDDITTGSNNVIINGGNYQNGTTSGFTATTSNSLWIGHSSYAWITGASSGTTRTVTIPGQLTAGGLTYPTSNGTSGQVLTSDGAGNVTWSTVSGGGGGAANVTISDTLPSGTPASGDLWWESDTGRLKIYYQDTDTAQWVDASPPLADATSIGGQGTVSMKASIIPDTNDTYDLGNAEYKIRDLYLGNNSIFIGDDFILGVNDTEDGNEQPEFRKRKRSENHVPKPILTAAIANGIGADKAAVVTHALAWFNAQLDPDAANLADKRITLRFWYAYGVAVLPASWREDYPSPKSLLPPPGDSEFDENEYEQITKIGQEGARKAPVIDGGAVVNVNLKLGFPHYVIKNPTGDITMNVSGAKWEEGAAFSATVYISQGAIARPLTGLKIRNPEGVLVNAGQLRPSGRPPEANEVSVYEIRAVFLDGAWKASKQGA